MQVVKVSDIYCYNFTTEA